MSSVNTLYNAIISKLSADIAVSVNRYSGQLGEVENKRVVLTFPALYVAFLGANSIDGLATGETELNTRWIVYAMTQSPGDREARTENAIDYAQAVIDSIMFQDFGVPRARTPVNLRIDNVFTEWADAREMAICAISWEQKIRI